MMARLLQQWKAACLQEKLCFEFCILIFLGSEPQLLLMVTHMTTGQTSNTPNNSFWNQETLLLSTLVQLSISLMKDSTLYTVSRSDAFLTYNGSFETRFLLSWVGPGVTHRLTTEALPGPETAVPLSGFHSLQRPQTTTDGEVL